jgi:hypothetical protein
MTMPGFTAEISLHRTNESYQMISVLDRQLNGRALFPAQFFTPNPEGPDIIPDWPGIPIPVPKYKCFRVCRWELGGLFYWCKWYCI